MMDFEEARDWLMNKFFLTDWERTWLESRVEPTRHDISVLDEILGKYQPSLDNNQNDGMVCHK